MNSASVRYKQILIVLLLLFYATTSCSSEDSTDPLVRHWSFIGGSSTMGGEVATVGSAGSVGGITFKSDGTLTCSTMLFASGHGTWSGSNGSYTVRSESSHSARILDGTLYINFGAGLGFIACVR